MKTWYIRNNDMRLGPFSTDDLKQIELYSDDYIWKEGLSTWTKANQFSELKEILISVEQCNFTLQVKQQVMFPVNYSLKRQQSQSRTFINPAAILFNAFAKGRSVVLSLTRPAALRPALGK